MSDQKRLDEVSRRITRIKEGTYPVVIGREDPLRITERPWKQVPEPSKLAILQDAVDWSGVTNRDRAHILLAEVDPGKISDAQRNTLIDMALAGGATASAGDEKPLSATEVKALHAEIRADEHAARARDFGQADAATYEGRMAEANRLRAEAGPVPPERLSYDQRLNDAAARMPSKSKDRERGHSR